MRSFLFLQLSVECVLLRQFGFPVVDLRFFEVAAFERPYGNNLRLLVADKVFAPSREKKIYRPAFAFDCAEIGTEKSSNESHKHTLVLFCDLSITKPVCECDRRSLFLPAEILGSDVPKNEQLFASYVLCGPVDADDRKIQFDLQRILLTL